MRTFWPAAACWLALSTLWATAADAQTEYPDTVLLRLPNQSLPVPMRGTVIDYTGEQIVLRTTSEAPDRTYPAAQVLDVQTPQAAAHIRGLQQFARREYAAAEESLHQAREDEQRLWVRREILALLMRCALAQGKYEAAGSRFLMLLQSDETTRHFHLLPLVWSGAPADRELQSAAQIWLTSETAVARLLGAAALLLDANHSSAATDELNRLVRNNDMRIRRLAQWQLWRKQVETAEPSLDELKWWESQVEAVPEPLRGGPYFVLGQGLWLRHEDDRAARALTWVPFVYNHDAHLAARASLLAAEAVSRIGQRSEAASLYRDILDSYPHTPSAPLAAQRLALLTGAAPATSAAPAAETPVAP